MQSQRSTVPLLLVVATIFSQTLIAQIPNPGFENWTSGNPDGWFTNNILPAYPYVTQVSQAHSGASAAKGLVLSFGGFGLTPLIQSGEGGKGFPETTRPGALRGFYTFSPVAGESISLGVSFAKNGVGIGYATASLPAAATYQEFVADIIYVFPDAPDTALIQFLVLNSGLVNVGTTYTIDDLSWGTPTRVEGRMNALPQSPSLEPNFPNPFNPETVIQYRTTETGWVRVAVFDLLGREVIVLVDEERPAGIHSTKWNAGDMPSGVYVSRLTSGLETLSRKMILMR